MGTIIQDRRSHIHPYSWREREGASAHEEYEFSKRRSLKFDSSDGVRNDAAAMLSLQCCSRSSYLKIAITNFEASSSDLPPSHFLSTLIFIDSACGGHSGNAAFRFQQSPAHWFVLLSSFNYVDLITSSEIHMRFCFCWLIPFPAEFLARFRPCLFCF